MCNPNTKKKTTATSKRKAWTDADMKKLMGVYNGFLAAELKGEAYTKASAVRSLAADMDRTKGSIEAKMMNVSAVLRDHGKPFVNGYKPLPNYSKTMVEQVMK